MNLFVFGLSSCQRTKKISRRFQTSFYILIYISIIQAFITNLHKIRINIVVSCFLYNFDV